MHPYITELHTCYRDCAQPENAPMMEAYMKGIAPFFGIQTTERRMILREFMRSHPLPSGSELQRLVRDGFRCDERELHYAALEMMQHAYRSWTGDELPLLEELLQTKPWWDSVDVIAVKLIGPWFLKFPADRDKTVRRWMRAGDFWTRRAAIIFQNAYKSKTDEALLFEAVRANAQESEFFLRKGIGWALREYAKTRPDAVRAFVDEHALSPLSKREALKHLG